MLIIQNVLKLFHMTITPSPRVSWVESGHETNQPDPFPRERVGSRHETSNFIVVAALTWQNVEL